MERINLLIFLGLVLSIGAYGQNRNTSDSLQSLLSKGTKTEEILACLIEQSVDLVDRDNQKALMYIRYAQDLASTSADTLSIVKCLRIAGQVLNRIGRTDEAIEMYEHGLRISRRNGFLEETLRLLSSYGVVYSYKSEFDKALKNFFDSYEIALILKDSIYLEMNQNNIGVVYYKLKDYRKALYYWTAASKSEKSRNEASFFKDMNISLAHTNLREFEQARKALNESIKICGSSCPKEAFVHIKYASGCIYLGLKNYEMAENEFLVSYRLSNETNNVRLLLDNIYFLVEIYQKQKRITEALHYLSEGEKLLNKGVPFNLEVMKLYQRFFELHMALKSYEKAASYQARYIQLKDSLYDQGLMTNLMRTEAEHLEKTNAAKIEAQSEVIKLKEEMLRRQAFINMVVAFLAISILGCSILLFYNYRQKRHMNQLLDNKIKQRTFELEMNRNELVTSLTERDLIINRIAIHITETMKTIKGLCYMGGRESCSELTDSCLKKILQNSCETIAFLELVKAKNENSPSKADSLLL